MSRQEDEGTDRPDSVSQERPAVPASDRGRDSQEETDATASAFDERSLIPVPGLELDGKLRIGRLKFKNLWLNDVSLPIESDDRSIRLDPVTASLYQGNYRGRIEFDASVRPPRITVDDALTGIQMGPLLEDLVGADYLTGTADITSSLTMRSLDRQLLRPSLNGTSQLMLRDGAVKGVNVPRTLQEGYWRLKGEQPPVRREPIRTDFASLSASYVITDGMAETDDLSFESSLLRVQGNGVTDLVRERLDYRLTTVLVDIPGGSRYEELRLLEGVEVPIEMTGSLDRPELAVDVATLARRHAPAVIEEHQVVIRETLERDIYKHLDESTQKKAKDLLKKLF
jgi:AsmA protein